MDPAMKPFWMLCIVASTFIMLSESTENTMYNMAQVGRITQLVGGLCLRHTFNLCSARVDLR